MLPKMMWLPAGFEVEVRIHNDIARSVEDRETDRAERIEARAEMLSDRAARTTLFAFGLVLVSVGAGGARRAAAGPTI